MKSLKWLSTAAMLAAALTLSACSMLGRAPATAPAGPAPAPHDYLIGPGDNVTTPLVEDLEASGKTASQLARDIETALGKYIQQPVVTVIVTGFVGTYGEQIRVIGQAAKPQSLPYRRDMSLMDVLIAVGGVTEFASGNKASIIRTVNGKTQKVPVRLNDLIKDGDISANIPVQPGDVLVIPESFF